MRRKVRNFSNMKKELEKFSQSNGYVALVSVLAVGVIGSIIATSLLILGLGSSRSSFAQQQSNQAKGLANACVEDALEQIRINTSFTTGGTQLILGQGTCNYTVTNDGAENRTIQSTGTVGSIVRKVKLTITAINPKIIISTTNPWQEVGDF